MKKIFWIFLFFVVGTNSVLAVNFPKYQNFVTDYTQTLSTETTTTLNSQLKKYEEETGNEIAVILIKSTEEMPISQYATELGNEWGVGKEKVDNGVILVVAKQDQKLFIATGSQMEGALTDAESHWIINEIITPNFKTGNFNHGITEGVNDIISAINGESFTKSRTANKVNWVPIVIISIVFFLVFVVQFFAAFFARSKRIWPGGIFGIFGGQIISLISFDTIFSMKSLLIIIGTTVVGLLLDWFFSNAYQKFKKNGITPWWVGEKGKGGSSSHSSGGGSSFGGFGGFGGGGFSGGGAGGSW